MLIWLVLVVALLVLGAVLLGLEIFVIPGFGVVGFMGIAGLLGAVVLAAWKLGALEAAGAFVLGAALVGGLLWYLPRSGAGKAMVLTEVQQGTAARTPKVLAGNEGVAATPLRPSGIVRFAERELDVISEGLFVDAGTPVRVTRVEGATVFVEPISNYQGG